MIRNESVKMRKEAQRLASEGNGSDAELTTAIEGQEEAERHADAQIKADRIGLEVPDGISPEEALANAQASSAATRTEKAVEQV